MNKDRGDAKSKKRVHLAKFVRNLCEICAKNEKHGRGKKAKREEEGKEKRGKEEKEEKRKRVE